MKVIIRYRPVSRQEKDYMKNANTPKDKLFRIATELFFQYGYRAVGVDTITSESGIGKMTLYRHFGSKDDLIVAFLKESNKEFWEYFKQSTKDAPTAREKLLAFFEVLQNYLAAPACFGCPFINLVSEYPEIDYPGHQVALEHKQSVLAWFNQLAIEAGAKNSEMLANALLLLMDGAYIGTRMFGSSPDNPASIVAAAAKILIDAQCI